MSREVGSRKKKDRVSEDDRMGFGEWGGYMAAKRAKLLDQFHGTEVKKVSNIFDGVKIHVNGLTKPPIDELKNLMSAHGGVFHGYQVSSTTHIIASNLPNVKIKHLGSVPIVKPAWVTDSISMGKCLDYRRYLLYTNQSVTQPRIDFPVIDKPDNKTTINSTTANPPTPTKVAQSCTENSTSVQDKTVVEPNHRNPTKTAADPNFLEEFYNNSRLHLISTLGAEFKQLVGQMRDKSNGIFLGKEKLIQEKGKNIDSFVPNSVVMHIDMDCFFVSVGLRNHPELRGKPVAVTHARNGQMTHTRPDQKSSRELELALYTKRLKDGMTSVVDIVDKLDGQSSMSEIASCSYEARKCGIKNGMFLGQAVKLCPELKTLQYDFEGYKEVSKILYQTIASYTLDIEAVSCDEMYVDITKILKDTGLSVVDWATHIRNEIMTITGCPCSTGFGANRLQARLATRKAKPAGQYYLQADDVDFYMAEIPLADLPGVGRATLAKLKNLGLNSCGDVQVASLKVLQSEIGQKAGETLKEQSQGIDRRPLNFYHERKSVSAEINYGIRFKTLQESYTFLQSLSNEVYNRLNDIGMRARCLTLKLLIRAAEAPVETAKFLGHGVCDALSKSTTSNIIINDPKIIFREAKILYDKINPSFVDLRGVGIQLSKLEKNAPVNKALSNFLTKGTTKKLETPAVKSYDPCDAATEPNEKTSESEREASISTFINKGSAVRDCEPSDSDNKSAAKAITSVKKVSPQLEKNKVTTSKRGRPKGGKNARNIRTLKSTENITTLNKFVSRQKSTSYENSTQQNTRVKEEIDLNVLSELPEELRNEIIREYQLENKMQQFVIASQKSKSKDENMTMNSKQLTKKVSVGGVSNDRRTEKIQAKKSPFSGLTWEEIKPIIKQWIHSGNEPSDVDTEMIAEHFKHLAVERKIETLKSVFNFLYRIFSELNCAWHKAYFSIVNITQEGMVARYGSTLMVNRKFECCHI